MADWTTVEVKVKELQDRTTAIIHNEAQRGKKRSKQIKSNFQTGFATNYLFRIKGFPLNLDIM